jgi:predicted nucleotidyltransferase component of viral defense system
MLETSKHKVVLLNILREIFNDNQLSGQVVFKGGTCLMLFYGLDRFSTDLDFDLRDKVSDINRQQITKIVAKHLTIDMDYDKHFTYYWSGSYQSGLQRIKLEVNKRPWPQAVEYQDFYGLTIPTLAPDKMFAHKLVAITDRRILQNRDLYDAYFMFNHGFEIDQSIVKLRTGLTLVEYLEKLLDFLDNPEIAKNVLFGLGEVLDNERKTWVKNNLMRELIAQIKIHLTEFAR